MKSFALSLAFIMRFTATRKWPIEDHLWGAREANRPMENFRSFLLQFIQKHCPVFFACFPWKKALARRVTKGWKGKNCRYPRNFHQKVGLDSEEKYGAMFWGFLFLGERRGGMGYSL